MGWTLEKIQARVRKLTGQLQEYQLSAADLLVRINDFYRNKLPIELQPERLRGWWIWNTIGAYQLATGDGVNKTFAGTLSSVPQLSGVGFTDGNEVFESDDAGNLWGSYGGSGTIDYVTGAYSVIFNQAPFLGAQIGVYFDGQVIPDNVLSISKPVQFSQWPALMFDDESLFTARWPSYQQLVFTAIERWAAGRNHAVNNLIAPTVLNGFYYVCMVAGQSGGSEPTWSTTVNGITADGSVQWLTLLAEQQVPAAAPYVPNTPAEVLNYGRRITMRPPPDTVYLAKFGCIMKPNVFVGLSDVPLQDEWGEYIAIGTAVDILTDSGDLERIVEIAPAFRRAKTIASRPDLLALSSGTRAKGRW